MKLPRCRIPQQCVFSRWAPTFTQGWIQSGSWMPNLSTGMLAKMRAAATSCPLLMPHLVAQRAAVGRMTQSCSHKPVRSAGHRARHPKTKSLCLILSQLRSQHSSAGTAPCFTPLLYLADLTFARQHEPLKAGVSLKGFERLQFLHCRQAPAPAQVCKIFFAIKRCFGSSPLLTSAAQDHLLLNTAVCHRHCLLCLSFSCFQGLHFEHGGYQLLCKGT